MVRWTDRPDMNIAVDCDIKNQTKTFVKGFVLLFCLLKSYYPLLTLPVFCVCF